MKKLYGILKLESTPFDEWYAQTNLMIRNDADVEPTWTKCLSEFEGDPKYTKNVISDDEVIYYSESYSYKFKKFEIKNNINVKLHLGC